MTTSRVGAVIDALVTTFTAGTAAKVFDGPVVVSSAPTTFAIVGGSISESLVPIQQDWAGLGHNSRNETAEVPCAVVSQSGDSDPLAVKRHRDAALVLLAQLEAAVVADPTLGGAVAAGWLHITSGVLTQDQNQNGCAVSITFTVSYKARLQS